MSYEDIFEPIEVLAHFRQGCMRPLKFLWNGRAYQIRQVERQWRERMGSAGQWHFSVRTADANWFELIFHSGDFTWQIARVYIEG